VVLLPATLVCGRTIGGLQFGDETARGLGIRVDAARGSGGQRQRAWISMTLAQGTGLLLLDEPITYLDLAHQIDVLDLVHRLHTERGTTVVMVLHDLNLAARYADTFVAMRDGRIVAQGEPADVLTEPLLAEVFGLAAKVLPDPVSGTPLVLPISAHLRT
jgi:iron complex transport system ATP-binding protein